MLRLTGRGTDAGRKAPPYQHAERRHACELTLADLERSGLTAPDAGRLGLEPLTPEECLRCGIEVYPVGGPHAPEPALADPYMRRSAIVCVGGPSDARWKGS